MYQATQSALVKGLKNSIQVKIENCAVYFAFMIIIPSLLAIFWFLRYRKYEIQLRNLYCQIIQFPQIILKDNNEIFRKIEKIL